MFPILKSFCDRDGVIYHGVEVCWSIHFNDAQLIPIMFDYLFDTGTVGMLCVSVQRELE